ncbi:MAG: hypothetical protein IJR96_00575 [Pseudobutyrivibrio sp.]|nr:hypothetical protein [Pseudobutyrivibrio sp.]
MDDVLGAIDVVKALISIIGLILFGMFGFYYAMKKNELELLLAGEKTRKMHDLGILFCTCFFCGFFNFIIGITDGFLLKFENLYLFLFSGIVCLIGYVICSFMTIRKKKHYKWFSLGEDAFSILLVVLVGALASWVDFAATTILYCKKNNILEDETIKTLLATPFIELVKTIDLQTSLWICLGITVVEGLIITIMLLNLSLGDSTIQLTMYDGDGNVVKDHVYVYSRIGKRLMCGDSPRMATSYKHIYSVSLDDIYKNEKNAFNFYYMSEEERKHEEELKEKKAQEKAKKKKEKLEKKEEQRETKEIEKAKKAWLKAQKKKAKGKNNWFPKIAIKGIKFWVKGDGDDFENPDELENTDDVKDEVTSQENKEQ